MTGGSPTPDHAREEYSQLRTEMTQLFASTRTAWLTVVTSHAAVAAILVALLIQLYVSSSEDHDLVYGFVKQGGLVMASGILLIFQMAIINLAHGWLAEAYYIGSYVVVFHEQRDPALEWITRNRNVKNDTLRSISDPPTVGYLGYTTIFFFLGFSPAAVSFALVLVKSPFEMPPSFTTISWAVLLLVVLCYYLQYRRLMKSGTERACLTEAWQEEWNRVHGSTIPMQLRGYVK